MNIVPRYPIGVLTIRCLWFTNKFTMHQLSSTSFLWNLEVFAAYNFFKPLIQGTKTWMRSTPICCIQYWFYRRLTRRNWQKFGLCAIRPYREGSWNMNSLCSLHLSLWRRYVLNETMICLQFLMTRFSNQAECYIRIPGYLKPSDGNPGAFFSNSRIGHCATASRSRSVRHERGRWDALCQTSRTFVFGCKRKWVIPIDTFRREGIRKRTECWSMGRV